MIAGHFAEDIMAADPSKATVVAIGSRSQEKAAAFARAHNVERAFGSYADLVSDAWVDAVYVATPHPAHFDCAMLALRAGKHVLVEKPFTMTAEQAEQLYDYSNIAGVFLMEAMWTRFLPHMEAVRELIGAGVLGAVRTVIADHGTRFESDAQSRLFAPELGGGALLDLGVYVVSFASMILGTPSRIQAVSEPAFTGVDASTSLMFRYEDGAHALLHTALDSNTPDRASVVGTNARIEIDYPFFRQTGFTVHLTDGSEDRFDFPAVGNGLRYQAYEVHRCVRAGWTESPVMSVGESVEIMRTLDEVRRRIGLVYPGE